MSVYLGTQLLSGVATNTISNGHSLFDFKWTDHIINEMSWLRSDTFSWQDGSVYDFAYNHLNADYNDGTSTTETIGSYTITYVLADDGHKITTDETNVANIFAETGVAWYYVLDTVNTRFKLPRTKYGFEGLRDVVGKYIPETLPNIIGSAQIINIGSASDTSSSGSLLLTRTSGTGGHQSGSTNGWARLDLDASSSSSAYQTDAPVQERATQMYLYFYVGQFSQSATEQTAGLNASLFNGKADVDLSNAISSASAYTKETVVGWCMPDYSAGVTVSSGFEAPKAGLVSVFSWQNSTGDHYVKVNGVNVLKWHNASSYSDTTMGASILVSEGDVITFTNSSNLWSYFFPMKGV